MPTEARTYCRRLARTHYENFSVLSWSLPRPLRQHFANLYAWCRWADDLADEVGSNETSTELLQWWRDELAACYTGSPAHPVLVALRETIRQFDLSRQPFEDLLSAFEQDQRVTAYESFAELRDYCRRSANPVGRLVLALFNQAKSDLFDWSDSVCTGLQLANFWQDVARDADRGRVYLPRDECRRYGYSPEDLERRATNFAFRELMQFQVERARDFLWAGLPLVDRLGGRLGIVIEMFARGGLRILDRIEAIDYRVWETRPVIAKRELAAVACGCLARSTLRGMGLGSHKPTMVRRAEESKALS
jgi:squalene synthase HpnC